MSEPVKQYEWEAVNKDSMTYKMKIPGGWLYRVSTYQGVGVAFVPEEDEPIKGVSIDPSSR